LIFTTEPFFRLLPFLKRARILSTSLILTVSFSPIPLAFSSVTECFPKCSVDERKRALEYLQIELNRIEPRVKSLQKSLNGLRNELSVAKFNLRRSQTGVKITTTSSDTLQSNIVLENPGAGQKIRELQEEIEEKENELFSFKSEVSLYRSERDAFINLTPITDNPPLLRTIRNPEMPSTETQGLTMGEDAFYDDEDNLKFLIGDYYALLVGISEYQDLGINDLVQPAIDVQNLKKVLSRDYNFLEQNTFILTDPTREELLNHLDMLSGLVNANDSLLIFYAGHGFWDEKFEQGYWLPSDAKPNAKASWISNATIRDYMKGIGTKHTLLISDACFSGGLFRTRSAFNEEAKLTDVLFQLTSRKAITSGTLTEVPDNSVFLKYLLKQLEVNPNQYLTSSELFNRFRLAVLNNSMLDQVPQHGVVQGSGDEGGDFIFKKNINLK
jgi:hypothetical protein